MSDIVKTTETTWESGTLGVVFLRDGKFRLVRIEDHEPLPRGQVTTREGLEQRRDLLTRVLDDTAPPAPDTGSAPPAPKPERQGEALTTGSSQAKRPAFVRITNASGYPFTVGRVYPVSDWRGETPVVANDHGVLDWLIYTKWEPADAPGEAHGSVVAQRDASGEARRDTFTRDEVRAAVKQACELTTHRWNGRVPEPGELGGGVVADVTRRVMDALPATGAGASS